MVIWSALYLFLLIPQVLPGKKEHKQAVVLSEQGEMSVSAHRDLSYLAK